MKDHTYRNEEGDCIFIERSYTRRSIWLAYISDEKLAQQHKKTTGVIFYSYKKARESVEKLRNKKYEWTFLME